MPVAPPLHEGEAARLVVRPPRRHRGGKPTWCPGTHRLRLIQVGGKKGSITLATRTFVVD